MNGDPDEAWSLAWCQKLLVDACKSGVGGKYDVVKGDRATDSVGGHVG